MVSECPLCLSSQVKIFETGLPSFTHLDFSNLQKDSVVALCENCHLIFNAIDPKEVTSNDQTFRSQDYAQSQQTIQTIKVQEFAQPVTRSYLQAEIIRSNLAENEPMILDIGCFDGELLKELNDRFPHAELHGFDVNGYLKDLFPQESNFHLWLKDMNTIKGSFDLICLSHSMMYVKDIHALMGHVKRLLKPNGILYVQTANINRNPFSLLLGDQYYYYTPEILKNIFAYFGMELEIHDIEWFSREIAGIATFNPHIKPMINKNEPSIIYDCLNDLKNIKNQLKTLSMSQPLRVLGTSANAAFADSILDSKNAFFVDENPKRIGQRFRNKDVRSPEVLEVADVLVIPYRETSQKISDRFTAKYKGQFICV